MFLVTAVSRETGEIMAANEVIAGFFHYFKIKIPRQVPCTAEFKRRKNFSRPNAISINFTLRREPGVKVIGHTPAAKNPKLRRQTGIESGCPTFRSQPLVDVHMGALGERVDAGIGASCTVNSNELAGDSVKSALQMVLDGPAMLLTLPAGEMRAVISNQQL